MASNSFSGTARSTYISDPTTSVPTPPANTGLEVKRDVSQSKTAIAITAFVSGSSAAAAERGKHIGKSDRGFYWLHRNILLRT